ncbi:hypothetical protein F3Y22_tig00110332pilonHSYRG00242 [Hibiscus syriacus]|uniref:Uncharacterized protein n=1 Tax=Hibiscus syriacus TaxID=106335 RepID=A0A6A3B135_HIBSY|nr:hypothetical protein F3Y22_tig00110332pilonHSYRG00242 [Hibiscus syriacus]
MREPEFVSGFSLVSLAGGNPAVVCHRTPPPSATVNGGRNFQNFPKHRSGRLKDDFVSLRLFLAILVFVVAGLLAVFFLALRGCVLVAPLFFVISGSSSSFFILQSSTWGDDEAFLEASLRRRCRGYSGVEHLVEASAAAGDYWNYQRRLEAEPCDRHFVVVGLMEVERNMVLFAMCLAFKFQDEVAEACVLLRRLPGKLLMKAVHNLMRLQHIIILQSKVDLIQENVAIKQHEAIQKFIQGTVANGAPVGVNQFIEVRPEIVVKDEIGNRKCTPIYSRIVSLYAEQNELQFAVPGGREDCSEQACREALASNRMGPIQAGTTLDDPPCPL